MATHPTSQQTVAKPVLVESPGAIASPKLDGAGLRIGLVYTRQCWEIVEALLTACRGELLLKGVSRSDIHELQVSQPFEIPYAMKSLMKSSSTKLDAVVVIGCMIKGATMSFEFVAEAVTRASMKIGMKMKTPVVYGVLTCLDEHQARICAGSTDEGDKTRSCGYGVEWAQSAIEMAHINKCATKDMVESCACDCHCATKGKGGECTCTSGGEHQKQYQSTKSATSGEHEEGKEERGDDEHLSQKTSKMNLSPLKKSVQHSLQKGECRSCGCMGK